MHYPGFIGGSVTERSVNVNAERTINFFPRIIAGTPKVQVALYGTPGLAIFSQPSTGSIGVGGPVRALFEQDGRCFTVCGSGFYELDADGAATSYGTVEMDEWPATICSNGVGGFQLFIVSGGKGYIFDLQANELEQITSDGFPDPAVMGAYSAGYFIVLEGDTHNFYISSLNDGTEWDASDVAQVSNGSNNILSLAVDHTELWLFGGQTTEAWYNSGGSSLSDFPYQPIQGVFIQHGILAPWSLCSADNTLFWVGSDKLGARMVWRMQGYTPLRVSTHPVELALGRCTAPEKILAYTYQDEGHTFYVLCPPVDQGLDTNYVYDISTNMWHERAQWDYVYARWRPHIGRCHCYAFGKHLLGDRQSSTIYEYSLDFYDDELALVEGL